MFSALVMKYKRLYSVVALNNIFFTIAKSYNSSLQMGLLCKFFHMFFLDEEIKDSRYGI